MINREWQYHEQWLGLVLPTDGLVVSVPVLVDAQCMARKPPAAQRALEDLCRPATVEPGAAPAPDSDPAPSLELCDLGGLLTGLLEFPPDCFDLAAPEHLVDPALADLAARGRLPEALCLYVAEGRQVIRPSLGLRKPQGALTDASALPRTPALPSGSVTQLADPSAAERAGASYDLLIWDVPAGLDLDTPETITGPWDYPAAAKFDRLLRATHVPIGLITNRRELRLVYAPKDEASGWIAFRLDAMLDVGGRPVLEALLMLLGRYRWHAAAPEHQLPALLEKSRRRQADVTERLADQVFGALNILLTGLEDAADRDQSPHLTDALHADAPAVYEALLTVLLRMVFILAAEERTDGHRPLLPTDVPFYAQHLSLLGLYRELQADAATYPDTMRERFGAWDRFIALCRAIYLGADHHASLSLHMPPRRGELFDPHRFALLEGGDPGSSAPVRNPALRAAVRLPSVDDGCMLDILERLLVLEGQQLSYKALEVEQIGSVYESLVGYRVERVPAPAVCLGPHRVWVSADELCAEKPASRAKWLAAHTELSEARAKTIVDAVEHALHERPSTSSPGPRNAAQPATRPKPHAPVDGQKATEQETVAQALMRFRVKGTNKVSAGRLVLQPGDERKRSTAHYTPSNLTGPMVERTLEPLLLCMQTPPSSAELLNLKICDPAMGSGAFLVGACRFLAERVKEAWTRERVLDTVVPKHEDPLNVAKRLVAQRCLIGVDKNPLAVSLGKVSLWLETLARDEPLTFLDHALHTGDSLVGLSFQQIRSFHWQPDPSSRSPKQLELPFFGSAVQDRIDGWINEAAAVRQEILALANDSSPAATLKKGELQAQARDTLEPVRLIGDLVVGAYFAGKNDKAREQERLRRLDLVARWLSEAESVGDGAGDGVADSAGESAGGSVADGDRDGDRDCAGDGAVGAAGVGAADAEAAVGAAGVGAADAEAAVGAAPEARAKAPSRQGKQLGALARLGDLAPDASDPSAVELLPDDRSVPSAEATAAAITKATKVTTIKANISIIEATRTKENISTTTISATIEDLAKPQSCKGLGLGGSLRLGLASEELNLSAPQPPMPTTDPHDPPKHLKALQDELRAQLPVFHWMAEFPEVFVTARPDPLLAAGRAGQVAATGAAEPAYLDAVLGNPPFAGKNGIATMAGPAYLDWLKQIHPGSHGNADYSAHFFRRASDLLGPHGTIGLIATNTIAQGDTRTTGLKYLVDRGAVIYDVTRDYPWPGNAAVTVSMVHLAQGTPAQAVLQDDQLQLDGAKVPAINSRLRGKPERPDPQTLAENAGKSFVGSYVLGMGFTLTPEEREQLVQSDPKNAERIMPYIGGQEINTSPTQAYDRYVINFGKLSLIEAEQWPELIDRVRRLVKPERDAQKDKGAKDNWWQFIRPRIELWTAIAPLSRCLVTACVSKHLLFSFQPTDRVFSHKLIAFPLDSYAHFGLLQSRVHELWTRLLSSTLKTDLNYAPSDCFNTFPFPAPEHLAPGSPLDTIAADLYQARQTYMQKTNQGLTKTYNQLKDPTNTNPEIQTLRNKHQALDQAVLTAYNWQDLKVPPFEAQDPKDLTNPLISDEAKGFTI